MVLLLQKLVLTSILVASIRCLHSLVARQTLIFICTVHMCVCASQWYATEQPMNA